MIDNLMPDIPRIYTAIAEWLACMLFILPLKKRFSRGRTIGIMVMAIVIQSAFLIATGDLVIYLWIPCMIAVDTILYNVFLLFIHFSDSSDSYSRNAAVDFY